MPIQKLLRQNDEIRKVLFERDVELKCLNLGIITGSNIGLFGGPGEGKTYGLFLKYGYLKDSKSFYRNFHSFTKPEELIGAFDLLALKEGRVIIQSDNYLPCANASILDEAGRGQSIKGILLPLVNEGYHVQDGILMKRPFKIMDAFLSNSEFTNPDDEALDDRIAIRHFVQELQNKESFDALLDLNASNYSANENDKIALSEIEQLRKQCLSMSIPQDVKDAIFEIRTILRVEEKIYVTPRTYRQAASVVNANAMLNGRSIPAIEDCEVLNHVFAVRKATYSKVCEVVRKISNAELDNILSKLDSIEKINETFDGDKANARMYSDQVKVIKLDFENIKPSKRNENAYQESHVRIKEIHGNMLKTSMKQMAKL